MKSDKNIPGNLCPENDAVICHVCHAAEGKIATIRGKNCGLV